MRPMGYNWAQTNEKESLYDGNYKLCFVCWL